MLKKLQKKKITKMFNALDTNGNGFITLDDFIAQFERFAGQQKLESGTPEYNALRAEQIKQWTSLQLVADANNDGEVTVDEFINYADRVVNNPDAFESYMVGGAEAYFNALDKNGDGTLSLEEFKGFSALSNPGEAKGQEANHEEVFKSIDVNGNGKISRDEFLNLFRESVLSDNINSTGNKITSVN